LDSFSAERKRQNKIRRTSVQIGMQLYTCYLPLLSGYRKRVEAWVKIGDIA
jgi:hypothetical protein